MTDQTAIYDAIDAFQRTHRLPGLQHAQIRGLLAEHLARVLPAAPAAVPSAPANGASAPSDEDFLVAVEEALESTLLPSPGVSVLERTLDAVTDALAPLVAKVRAASTPAAPPAPADRTAELSPAERTMLTYALNQAQLRMWATGKFTDEDQAAVTSLRRMADEAQQPETQAEVVHGCPPDGSGLTPCCGRTPFELPLTDRISSEEPITCPAAVSQPGKEATQ